MGGREMQSPLPPTAASEFIDGGNKRAITSANEGTRASCKHHIRFMGDDKKMLGDLQSFVRDLDSYFWDEEIGKIDVGGCDFDKRKSAKLVWRVAGQTFPEAGPRSRHAEQVSALEVDKSTGSRSFDARCSESGFNAKSDLSARRKGASSDQRLSGRTGARWPDGKPWEGERKTRTEGRLFLMRDFPLGLRVKQAFFSFHLWTIVYQRKINSSKNGTG
jgi:hypothetical protein